MAEQKKEPGKLRRRLEAMGWGAFMFFLLKGLAWLAVFYGLWSC